MRTMKTSLDSYRNSSDQEMRGDVELERTVLDEIMDLKNSKVRVVQIKCSDEQ